MDKVSLTNGDMFLFYLAGSMGSLVLFYWFDKWVEKWNLKRKSR